MKSDLVDRSTNAKISRTRYETHMNESKMTKSKNQSVVINVAVMSAQNTINV